MTDIFSTNVTPNWEGLLACIKRKNTPERVHHIELFLDKEVNDEICKRFNLMDGFDSNDAYFDQKKAIQIQRALGYDYVRQGLEDFDMPIHKTSTDDTAGLQRDSGRSFTDESKGPITTWAEFEQYQWPDPEKASTRALEWYENNLPDDMCIIAGGGFAHFAEYITWLMGYETLCFALYDNRDLVKAISDRLNSIFEISLKRLLKFDRVKIVWGSDDLGFKGGTMISPDDIREFILPGHKKMVEMSHKAGKPYLLHSCGNLDAIMDDLIDNVGIDAKHSFEDTIEHVEDAKQKYGDKIAILGGIDVDFLCRSKEEEIRGRVRKTLNVCMPGGGYCLGTGNSVANYIPIDNYLAMVDEGRKYSL